MKSLFFFLSILLSFNSQAETAYLDQVVETNIVELDSTHSCIDEYNARRKRLLAQMLITPPAGAIGIPVSGFIGGYSAAIISELAGATGWDTLGYAIGGLMLGAASTFVATVTSETIAIDKYIKTLRMMKLITEAHSGQLKGKITQKYLKKFNRKHRDDRPLDAKTLHEIVIENDENGKLCNGYIRKGKKNKKLKHLLALKRDLFKHIDNRYYQ